MKKETADSTNETQNAWVWVDGFKAMDEHMRCRDMQFEIGGEYIHEGDVVDCKSGFHLCKYLSETILHYDFNFKNRFFRVKALVRKSDFYECSDIPPAFRPDVPSYKTRVGGVAIFRGVENLDKRNKLAAKEVKIISEITDEEYVELARNCGYSYIGTCEDYKNSSVIGYEAFKTGVLKSRILDTQKYSEAFVDWLLCRRDTKEWLCNMAIALAFENISHDTRITILANERR